MAGAPQGPVYQVSVLETAEFEPSPNPAEEMRAVRAASAGGGDWADLYSAVDSARRLCIFHGDAVISGTTGEERGGDGSNLEDVVSLLAVAVGNLRSSMVRNALLGVGDIFRWELALYQCVREVFDIFLMELAAGAGQGYGFVLPSM